MTRIYAPGNKEKRDGGFVLLDALLSLFLVSLLLLAVREAAAPLQTLCAGAVSRGELILEARNRFYPGLAGEARDE